MEIYLSITKCKHRKRARGLKLASLTQIWILVSSFKVESWWFECWVVSSSPSSRANCVWIMRSFFSTSFLILVDLQKNLPIKERADKVDFQYCNISDINVDNTTWKLWWLHYLVLAENRWPNNSDLRIFVAIDILYLTTLGSHQKIIWKGFIFIENLECQSAWKLKLGKGSFFKTLYVGEQYYSDLII